MAQVKCTECGQLFNDDMLNACPKCGCSASECVSIHNETNVDSSEKTSEAEVTVRKDVQTTDTGYRHEKVIQRYATCLFWGIIIPTVLGGIFLMMILNRILSISEYTKDMIVPLFLLVLVLILIVIIIACIIRAFLMIYVNMSINLHELNMKLQCKETLQSHYGTNIQKEDVPPLNGKENDLESSIIFFVVLIISIILISLFMR